MLAAVLSASMIFSMAPAGVWAAETVAVQEAQEESGEFDAAIAAAENSEEALAGGSDAASAEVAEEAESGAADAVAADVAEDADEAGAVDEAAGAEADTADAEDAVAADEAGADADMADTDADEDASATNPTKCGWKLPMVHGGCLGKSRQLPYNVGSQLSSFPCNSTDISVYRQ